MRHDTLIDGVFQDRLSVDNRGFLYGDGLFETLAVVDGNPCLWRRHMARLQDGARQLRIGLPESAELLAEAHRVIANRQHLVLKIIVTRADTGRGYRGVPNVPGVRVVKVFPYPDYSEVFARQGVEVCVCQTAIGQAPALAGMKHLGRLEQVLARSEWHDPNTAEGLMCDCEGYVIEGTQSNLFIEIGGRLMTPALGNTGVAGVVRGLVMDAALTYGQEVIEGQFKVADLFDADALYLTNSLIGIWRVSILANHRYTLVRRAHPVIDSAMKQVFQP